MSHGVEYSWSAKNPAFYLFSGVPFGLTGLELLGWLTGSGAEHWDAIQAPFNIKPFSAGMLAGGLGVWSNRRLESLDDFDGLTIRSSGLARTLLKSLVQVFVLNKMVRPPTIVNIQTWRHEVCAVVI